MELNEIQQKTYEFLVKVYGDRTKGHEEDIKSIIVITSNLISEMYKNGDIGNFITKEYTASCLQNVRILYDIFEIIKPSEKIIEDEKSVYFILIMYCHQCEALSFLFKNFISKNAKAVYLKLDDVEKWLKNNKRKTVRPSDIAEILNRIEKNKDTTTLQDFISVFNNKYPKYSKQLFKGRFIPELRNAVSHNRLKMDKDEKTITFYINSKPQTLTFIDIVSLYDTLMMIYFAIVIELTQPRG